MKRLLLRKSEQTRVEGPRRASASHGSGCATLECTGHGHGAVHTTKFERKRSKRSKVSGAPAQRSRERSTTPMQPCCWKGAASLALRALHVVDAGGKPPGRWRCVHTWHACTPYGADVRARLMCSQAVEGQWSSHKVDIYDWTSRGPLLFIIVIMVVQWFATRRRA